MSINCFHSFLFSLALSFLIWEERGGRIPWCRISERMCSEGTSPKQRIQRFQVTSAWTCLTVNLDKCQASWENLNPAVPWDVSLPQCCKCLDWEIFSSVLLWTCPKWHCFSLKIKNFLRSHENWCALDVLLYFYQFLNSLQNNVTHIVTLVKTLCNEFIITVIIIVNPGFTSIG